MPCGPVKVIKAYAMTDTKTIPKAQRVNGIFIFGNGALIQAGSWVDLKIPNAGVHVFRGQNLDQRVLADQQRFFGLEFDPVPAGQNFDRRGNHVFILGDVASRADVDGTDNPHRFALVDANDGES